MKLSRREVYELIWSAPMTAMGRLLGISSVSLAKTCVRRGIPTPPRGYWQKATAGNNLPPRPPLGEVDVELPMPWDRTPIVETALARAIALSVPVVQSSLVAAAPDLKDKLESAQPAELGQQTPCLDQGAAEFHVPETDPMDLLPMPVDLETAIHLARRIADLRTLDLLIEQALEAGKVLPAREEDCLKTWVSGIRSLMRDIDPMRQLVDIARVTSEFGAGKGRGKT